jgi:hypothetical protein
MGKAKLGLTYLFFDGQKLAASAGYATLNTLASASSFEVSQMRTVLRLSVVVSQRPSCVSCVLHNKDNTWL